MRKQKLFFPKNQTESSQKKRNVLSASALYSPGIHVPCFLLGFLKGAMTNSDDSHRMKASMYLE